MVGLDPARRAASPSVGTVGVQRFGPMRSTRWLWRSRRPHTRRIPQHGIRKGDAEVDTPQVYAFIYPKTLDRYRVRSPERYNHLPYLTNVNAIEHFTGLNVFSNLHPDDQELIEQATAFELWEE